MRVLILFALAGGMSLGFATSFAVNANAGGTKSASPPAQAATAAAPAPGTNKCGCYEDSGGACHCAKKSQCGCPGECEPAGCEEKRQKQFAKEAEDELKRQQQEDKKRNAELAKKQEELEKQDAAKRERGLRGLRLLEQQK